MDVVLLSKALSDVCDPSSERYRNAVERAQGMPKDLAESNISHELAEPVAKILADQAEFCNGAGFLVNTYNGYIGFQRKIVAPLLIREARRRGSANAAISWLEKILNTGRAEGIFVLTMWGIEPSCRTELSETIELVPFAALPESRQQARAADPEIPSRQFVVMPPFMWKPPTAALIVQVVVEPFLFDLRHGDPPKQTNPLMPESLLDEIRICLGLMGPRTVVPGALWFQFLDSDLEAATIFAGSSFHRPEIQPMTLRTYGTFDASIAQEAVRSYLRLSPGLRNRVRIAMERLHYAMLRRSPADQAMELAIALESLLVDDPGEHTFKIGLRASLIVEDATERREYARSIIEAVYRMRSALLHSDASLAEVKVAGEGKKQASEVAEEAVKICASVIRRILGRECLPTWRRFELSGGVEWAG